MQGKGKVKFFPLIFCGSSPEIPFHCPGAPPQEGARLPFRAFVRS